MENGGRSRVILVAVVYLSLFLDNVLLTVVGKLFKPFIVEDLFLQRYKTSCNWNNLIMNKKKNISVPIIPDYLCTLDGNSTGNGEDDENGRVGLLLSSKALVQLILNPAVGTFTGTLGYTKPLFLGNLSLLLAATRKLFFFYIPLSFHLERLRQNYFISKEKTRSIYDLYI